jgi:IclR helix-turn-helix domain
MRDAEPPKRGDEHEWSPRQPGGQFSQSVERGIAILECFTPTRPVRGITDVARELGMSPGTAHRYVSTLVELGFLERITRHKYRLTLAVTRLGLSTVAAIGLREHSERPLQGVQSLAPVRPSDPQGTGSQTPKRRTVIGRLSGGGSQVRRR